MCANVPNDVHSGDESMVRTVDTVQHVDTKDHPRILPGRKRHSKMVVELSDY